MMKADAGTADLDVTATSPSGQEIPLQVTPLNDGAEMIEFSPSVPGTYMINVTYGNYLRIRSFFEKEVSRVLCISYIIFINC